MMLPTPKTDVVAVHEALLFIPFVRAARRVLVGLARRVRVPDLGLVVAQPEVALPFEHFRGDGAGRRLTRENPQQRVASTLRPTDP